MEDIFDSYAEFKTLCVRRRENIIDYIERAQIVYDKIIETEKREEEYFMDLDVTRINFRFVHAFYCCLSSDIWTLIETRNDLLPIEIYKIVEKAN